jgi:hypothetical protein
LDEHVALTGYKTLSLCCVCVTQNLLVAVTCSLDSEFSFSCALANYHTYMWVIIKDSRKIQENSETNSYYRLSDSKVNEIHDEDSIASQLAWYLSTYSTVTPVFWFYILYMLHAFTFKSENSFLIIISRFHKTTSLACLCIVFVSY